MDLQISCVWGGNGAVRRLAPVSGGFEDSSFCATVSYAQALRKIAARAASIFIVFYGNYCMFSAIFGFSNKRAFAHMFSIHFGGARKRGESESGGADGGQLKRILHINSLLTENH